MSAGAKGHFPKWIRTIERTNTQFPPSTDKGVPQNGQRSESIVTLSTDAEEEAVRQVEGYRKILLNPEKKMYYHIWDEDKQAFERKLGDNLYRVWNRLSSGSYLPPPVRTVAIPKPGGGERKLGIPTVADRVAQMVVKRQLEPELDCLFHDDSYAYRRFKAAHDAVGQARRRCWRRWR